MSLLAAGLMAGGSVLGGIFGSRGSSSAASAMDKTARRQIKLAEETRDINIDLNQPFRQAGLAGQAEYLNQLGFTPRGELRSFKANDGTTTYYLAGMEGSGPFKGSKGWHSKDADELQKYLDENQSYSYQQDAPTHPFQGGDRYHDFRQDPLFRNRPKSFAWNESNPLYRDTPEAFQETPFEESPGYQYRLEQSEKALQRGANAGGLSLSGRMLTALDENAQGMASSEYGNWFARQRALEAQANQNRALYDQAYGAAKGLSNQDRALYDNAFLNYDARRTNSEQTALNRLAQLAGAGATATGSMTRANDLYTQNASSALGMAGQAQADNAINQANIFNSTLGNLAGTYGAYQAGLFGPSSSVAALSAGLRNPTAINNMMGWR